MNRILVEKLYCMFSNAGLSKEFWVEVVNSICYLLNRSSSIPINCRTLEEVWFSSLFNYTNFRIFCCLAYAHVNEGKLELKTRKCIFLGYADGVKWCDTIDVEILGMFSVYHSFLILFSVEILGMFKY